MRLAPTTPSGFSLGRRLLVAAGVALAAATVALVAISAVYSRQAADAAFDRLLAASALSIAGAVQVEEGRVAVEVPFAALAMLGFAAEDRIFYEVLDPEGKPVTGYSDLGEGLAPARAAEPVFQNLRFRGDEIRVVTVGRLISLADRAGWVTVRVGETRDARALLSAELTRRAVWPLLALAGVALLLVHLGVRRALRPLRAIEKELRARAPNDLQPLRAPAPHEVDELVTALNDFMARLGNVFGRLSSLLADAAHQVRTPLASLRAQAEIAVDETDPARLRDRLGRIHANAVQASQLVGQILMDATIIHRLESRENAPVPVAGVVEDALKSLDPAAMARIRTRMDPAAAQALVAGDRVALREMLKNLVENALLHAPEGPIDVTLEQSRPDRVALTVQDRGPGIPDDEKQAVLQRFRRGRAARDGTGSGLGLSIVDSVARGHGGALTLADRPGGGLVACVDLAAEPAPHRPALLASLLAAAGALALAALSAPGPARAADPVVTRFEAAAPSGRTLVIAGATDRAQFAPVIRDFQETRPDVAVAYVDLDTSDLQERFLAGSIQPPPDLLISSAIDLQVKLANDGLALAHDSAFTRALPPWARWRNEVFGFTFEPAVIVTNPDLVPEPPRSRSALAQLMDRDADRFRGKVATYDIVRSGVGHLLAAQDAQVSSVFWRLASAMGGAGAQLVCCSGEMIDKVERGELALAYNVLGSYAFARRAAGARIGVAMPSDYTLVLSRVMLIPRSAPSPDLARAFVDHVLSPRGQAVVAGKAGLGAILGEGPGTAAEIAREAKGPLQPITIGPWLLAFLDQQRRARFLQSWLQIVSPN
ncbi:sensor histidine kinase [Alsobacter sp. SYSU BS001988]